jgi:hypothetical protein
VQPGGAALQFVSDSEVLLSTQRSSSSCSLYIIAIQVFLIGPLEQLQPGGAALEAVTSTHAQFKGRFAFATAALSTDSADMLLNFFGVGRSPEIQVR